MRSQRTAAIALGAAVLALVAACGGSSGGGDTTRYTLTLTKAGAGAGTVTSTPSGINCGTTCAAQFDAGTAVTLSAAATGGSVFAGFAGGGCTGTAATCTVTVSAATTVTATFDIAPPAMRTLRVFAWGGGTTEPAPGIYTYDNGTVVTLTATAGAGTFTGWSDGTSATTTTVTMDGDKLIGARFFDATATSAYLPVPATGPVPQPDGTPGNLQVLRWAGFTAAVSYTLDDARVSVAYGTNYADLTVPGVPMTFYVSPSEVAKHLTFWQGVLADGQEIANHTEDHCRVSTSGVFSDCAYDYGVPHADQTPMDEIDAANDYIEDVIGQDGVFTMATPYGDSNWVPYATAAGFIANRRVGGTFVSADDLTDQMNLPDYWFGPVIEPGQSGSWGELGDTPEVINAKIDEVRAGNGWSTFLIHRLTPAPEDPADGCCAVPVASLTASMDYLLGLGDVWGGTVVDVAAYRIGKNLLDTATPVVTGETTTWTWTLPPNFPPGRFVRVTVDGGVLSQGGQDLVWDAHGYYEVALDAGELTLATAAPASSALRFSANTASNAFGDWGVVIQFAIPDPGVDLSTGDWTASADYYIPGAYGYPIFKSFAYQFNNGGTPNYSQAAATTYSGYATDTWTTLSFPLPAADFSALTAAKQFRIRFTTAFSNPPDPADGTPVVFYLRNIRLQKGTDTPVVDIPVTTATPTNIGTVTVGASPAVTIGMP
jgi:hypothetical protein